jgi:hypothetical protein
VTDNIVLLQSPRIVRPAERVEEFIRLARHDLNALIPKEFWENDVWSVSEHFRTKGQNRDNRILAFYNKDVVISNKQEVTGEPLSLTFKDFAKAYSRYMHSADPKSYEITQKRLNALQFIEAAFRTLILIRWSNLSTLLCSTKPSTYRGRASVMPATISSLPTSKKFIAFAWTGSFSMLPFNGSMA